MTTRFFARSLARQSVAATRFNHVSRWIPRYSYATSPQANVASATSAVLSTKADKDSLHVKWNQGNADSAYSYLWLRDNCQCEKCVHPDNRQKLHSSADVPLDIAPASVTLKGDNAEIVWNKPLRHQEDDQHVSEYPVEFLQRYASREASEQFRFNHIRPRTWHKGQYKLKWVNYNDYMNTDAGLHEVVQRLYNYGLVFLDNVPVKDEAVTTVAERIGPVQETFYGRDFDVKNIAKSRNIAYTSLYLGCHMDLM